MKTSPHDNYCEFLNSPGTGYERTRETRDAMKNALAVMESDETMLRQCLESLLHHTMLWNAQGWDGGHSTQRLIAALRERLGEQE